MAESAEGKFYLGNQFNPQKMQKSDQPLHYDPADLTTHAILIGMTGSGKTGAGICLLEEAALQGIPAIVIDPKGDLTNLLLHFPHLSPDDFEPWLDPDAARRANKTLAEFSVDTAKIWKDGLAGWGLGQPELEALQKSVQYSVFTPGSSSGKSVSILASFSAPDLPWEENREVLREKISSTVTALLTMVGMEDVDPLRSREHILLSNIMENAWQNSTPLDLNELILQTQKPPFDRLGAFPLDSFYPEKDRFALSMLLNNFMAAPSFQTWLEGEPLDAGSFLYTPEGKPRHSIFYLAHLNDNERMFFVSLLFAAIESWMRGQRGTSGLRALVYFDEIYGYLPPVSNPPTRTIIVRMLKQARAFGVGLILATQNPVDVDYKALSNTGTWMIGRLQTDQDKQRLLDGLQNAGGLSNRSEYDRQISALQKRVFLLHNVRSSKPQLFSTRWTLNFLAGPLTRAQIPALNRLTEPVESHIALGSGEELEGKVDNETQAGAPVVKATATTAAVHSSQTIPNAADKSVTTEVASQANPKPKNQLSYSITRPAVPAGTQEYFLPMVNQPDAEVSIVYFPALVTQARVLYQSRPYKLDYTEHISFIVSNLIGEYLAWEDNTWIPLEPKSIIKEPSTQVRYQALPAWLGQAPRLKTLRSDFENWIFHNAILHLPINEALKVYGSPGMTTGDFRNLCSQAARKGFTEQQAKIEQSYKAKLSGIDKKITQQQKVVGVQSEKVNQRRSDEFGANLQYGISLFSKRKRSYTTAKEKGRLTERAKDQLEEEKDELAQLEKEKQEIQASMDSEIKQAQDNWAQMVNDTSEVSIAPQKQNIYVELFGVIWMPYTLVQEGDQIHEVPAFTGKDG